MNVILRCIGLALMLITTAALAHHGWSEYDTSNPLELEGTIKEAGYSHPHGYVRLQTTDKTWTCLLYTSPSPRDRQKSRMPSSA